MATIKETQALMAANDYATVLGEGRKFEELCRYELMVNAVNAYNATCHTCNNQAVLIFKRSMW